MTNAKALTALRYPISTKICTKCKNAYAMFNNDLCGACEETEETPRNRCEYCGDIEGAYKLGNGGKMIRVQILRNGYCRKCFEIRKARV